MAMSKQTQLKRLSTLARDIADAERIRDSHRNRAAAVDARLDELRKEQAHVRDARITDPHLDDADQAAYFERMAELRVELAETEGNGTDG